MLTNAQTNHSQPVEPLVLNVEDGLMMLSRYSDALILIFQGNQERIAPDVRDAMEIMYDIRRTVSVLQQWELIRV